MRNARFGTLSGWVMMVFLAAGLLPQVCAGADADPKIVLDFEDSSEVDGLKPNSENVALDIVQDNCVTSGKNCLRVVGKMGQPWSSIVLTDPLKLKGFDKYDYVGLDVFSDRDAEIPLTLELWDKDSTNYQTRASLEAKKVHKGMNHLFWQINRARRNGKEGYDWAELQPKDKIDRANLTKVKLYFTPLGEGGDTMLWMDRLRLVPENMVGGKTEVTLPAGAIGYKFGSKTYCPKGFESITFGPAQRGMPRSVKDCIGTGIAVIGKDWPDTLTGNGLYCPHGDFTFMAKVPAGEYWVWLSAGKIFNRDQPDRPFALKVGDLNVVDEKFTERDFFGEKGIFRYLRTQYSERPDAMWTDYALPEAEEFVCKVRVAKSPLAVRVTNMRLSAMVLMPESDEAGFKKTCADIRAARIKYFNERTYVKKQQKPLKPSDVGPYTLWMPKPHDTIRPWSAPSAADNKTAEFQWHGARGERLTQRVCVTPWEDLGSGDIAISDFEGPSAIPASSIRKYYMNYRFQDASVDEMALLPWTRIRFEPGISWAYWLWMKIPDNAVPGAYTATLTFTPEKGGQRKIPIKLTVYPFKLEDTLPVAYGMYYGPCEFLPKQLPAGYKSASEFALALTKEQFKFMRQIGFTSTTLPAPGLYGGTLSAQNVEPYWDAAKAAGLGRHPDQKIMTSQLGLARGLARDMFGELNQSREQVDLNPGSEFTLPNFGDRLRKILAAYKQWIDKTGLPVAVEVVDEPRENPNPWNRRRDETIRYADWLKEAGFTSFVTFMSDQDTGKDYTPIVDHIGIASVHAWDMSRKVIDKSRKLNKTLWYYNTGMDRLSWGFFNWAMGSKGRWEWHFCWPGGNAVDGHPNLDEWYTPFTALSAYTNAAPYFDFPGGMTFKSAFFTTAEGITDYAYICTLEKAIAEEAGHQDKAKVVEEAKAFLASVKKAIPQYPGITNMTGADSGALVGAGFDTPVAQMTELWRSRIAELITQLKGK